MKKGKKKAPVGKTALDIIEEATHLLRSAPWSVFLCYYTGSIPFVLALLYFWSDMSHGAFAYDRIAGSSLGLAILFIWMKCWQSVSASKLMAFLSASEEKSWTFGRLLSLVVMQGALQPSGLWIRILALSITIPYGWVRAFYENTLILGDGSDTSLREMSRNGRRMAALWPKQNIFTILQLKFFGFVVWMNVALLMIFAPQLLKIFTGIETAFTQSEYTFLNTTFLATSIGCTYLCVNPLTLATSVLRCFYGVSLNSGDDLRLRMRRVVMTAATALVLLMTCAPTARAGSPPQTVPASGSVKKEALDDSIQRVLKRDEFAWRLPRQAPPDSSEGFLSRFVDESVDVFKGWMRPLKKLWGKILDKVSGWFNGSHPSESDGPSVDNLRNTLNVVLWVICALVIVLLGWLIWKNRRTFRRRTHLKAQAVAAVPDLNSEDVVASQLPEDEWVKLAREMMERGELRLAIRALYLATLAHLGLRELISIARYKSNRDYQRELLRRARTQGDLLEAFRDSVSIFEGVWYGSHTTTQEIVTQFSANIERIKTA